VRNGSFANTNYGSAAQLLVKDAAAPYDRLAYLTFNLTGLSGTNVSRANLQLFGGLQGGSNAAFEVNVLAVSRTNWGESTITFNDAPATGAVLASAMVTNSTSRWYTFNLTNYLERQRAAGKTSVSLAIVGVTNTSQMAAFNSRHAASNAPQLVVTSSPATSSRVS
jgi:hypothetical protein